MVGRSTGVLLAVAALAVAKTYATADSSDYIVDFKTDIKTADGSPGVFSVQINSTWAPLGAAHLRDLVEVRLLV